MKKQQAEMTKWTGILALVGMVVGTGIFFKPSAVLSSVPDATLGVFVWVVSGFITICGGLTIAEIGVQFPDSGGIITYLENAFGKRIAFIAGWSQMLLYYTGNIAGIAIIFGTQAAQLLGWGQSGIVPIALSLLSLMTLINLISMQSSIRFQSFVTLLKMVPIMLLIVLCFTSPVTSVVAFTQNPEMNKITLSGFGLAILSTLFAYDGWLNIGNLASEMKNPQKDLPKTIGIGIGIVTSIYVLMNIGYLLVATPQELSATQTPAALVADRLLSGWGSRFITIGILISVLGTENGNLLAGFQVPRALAKRHWMPFSKQNPQLAAHVGIGIMYGVSVFMILSGSFDQITNLGIFTIWIFTTVAFMTIFIFRKKGNNMGFRVPFYPIVPLIAIISALYILISTSVANPLILIQAGAVIGSMYGMSYLIFKNNTPKDV